MVDPPPDYTMMTDMDVRASSRVRGEPNNSGDIRLGLVLHSHVRRKQTNYL